MAKSKFELLRDTALEVLGWSGFDVRHLPVCQYELILESEFREGDDMIRFSATGEEEFITEIRLWRQDVFVCNEWGLFLLNTDGKSDAGFEEHTYPDREYFSDETADEAGIFYHANLSFVVNNLITISGVRTDRFKKYISVYQRRNDGVSGLREIEGGCLVLTGSKNIYFNLDLPRKIHFEDSEMRTMRLRLRLGGVLVRNACIVT
jgi:hypothetical protein